MLHIYTYYVCIHILFILCIYIYDYIFIYYAPAKNILYTVYIYHIVTFRRFYKCLDLQDAPGQKQGVNTPRKTFSRTFPFCP